MTKRISIVGWLLATVVVVCVIMPFARVFREQRRHSHYVDRVVSTIESFHSRRPADVPEQQWAGAVEWTRNVIFQDFFSPNPTEMPGLQRLAEELDRKAHGEVDLGTLTWIWDECERACGGPQSSAIRFRKVKLLTNGVITDDRLPSLWSLDRCTGLDLSGTNITDASIPFLKSLTRLESLDVTATGITTEGAKELSDTLSECRVFH